MSRVIKFRAWHESDKGKGFIQGFNLYNFHSYFNKGLEPHIERYDSKWLLSEITLEQFTGLNDKNSNPIYEGDIIKWAFVNTGEIEDDNKYYVEVVEWSDCGFFLDGGAPLTVAMDDCEVIGNIHQNSNLL